MDNMPVWQLPVPSGIAKRNDALIHSSVKYHCFVRNVTLCKKYTQNTNYYETGIESGEILSRPDIACKRCRSMWMKLYGVAEEEDGLQRAD